MTFYEEQILKIKKEYLPQEYQINQIIRAKQFIDSHYSNDIDLKDISNMSFFSKFHFIRTFKRCYGKTPHQYLTEVRIAKAKQLLQSGLTVSGTCFTLGFSSLSSFSGLFKKETGFTPNEFQRKIATLKK